MCDDEIDGIVSIKCAMICNDVFVALSNYRFICLILSVSIAKKIEWNKIGVQFLFES